MQGTITLRRADTKPVKAPAKKNDLIGVSAWIDGVQHDMLFKVPLSSTLLSGQRTPAYLSEAIGNALSIRFGKVSKL